MPVEDVLILGGGPAGRALAGECARRGLRTTLADPAPDRPWRATYGAWADELPPGLPERVVGARATVRAFGTSEHRLERRYAVLDTAALREHLDERMAGVRVVAGRARAVRDDGPHHAVILAGPGRTGQRRTGPGTAAGTGDRGPAAGGGRVDGEPGCELSAAVVVDATGAPGTFRDRPGRAPAEQTAYGVVVPQAAAAAFVGPGEALFMDWRPEHGQDGPPTFLYAVPYGDGRVLLEETSLARRPGLGLPELRDRLHARLARRGADPEVLDVERVRFPVDPPRAPAHPIAFGAATPLVHPSSGFSVATSLTLAPRLADALRDALSPGLHGIRREPRRPETGGPSRRHNAAGAEQGPRGAGRARGRFGAGAGAGDKAGRPSDRAAAAAAGVLWPPAARAVHHLRRHGLRTLLEMPPPLVPAFFDAFFRIPADRSRAFLGGRDDLPGTMAAMGALFRYADPAVRQAMVRSAVRRTPR